MTSDLRPPTDSLDTSAFVLEDGEQEFAALHRLLSSPSIEVQAGFLERVVMDLPEAAGEESVAALLAPHRITVREGFAEGVMALLPEAAGEECVAALLARESIEVRDGFAGVVMANLPETSWTRPARAPWGVAAAVVVVLGVSAALLLGSSSESALFGGLLASVGDLLAVSLAAGAGFLSASWGGLRTTATEALQGSPTSLAVLASMAIGAAGLLYSLLRRRAAKATLDSRE